MFEIDARSKAIGIITGGRVKALEDAGLAIIDKTELSELQSLAQAKADGRLVVLPCKVGTVVYAHSSVAGYDSIISGIVQYFVVHEQFIDLFVLFKPNPNEDKHDFAEYIRADKIGKTVFLTREEAEKALVKGECD